ncbi:hypothetical protein, conserved [Babesia bigemina]|uniref:Uncharacterized protein n=1 Tax=Babesia bigemina TaxID=5866 RepID=A0A061BM95_BABBI|nr:hypothetical protein, conserved [Babesia bigemina]CDR71986.1 hypothetical protein, conserved [Babesia bigemina]|eukprot:XP_012770927.1 hypothetical protein, conserved [Babesia bigemina]
MGFLSGVLSNIKEHLGQHKDTLNDAIEALKQNKHGGKKGFSVAIGKVVEGVRGYNDGVRNSNHHVKSKIEDLYNYVKTENGGKLLNDINAIQVNNPVDPELTDAASETKKLVERCLEQSRQFDRELNNAEQHINDLNLTCKTSVNSAHRNVRHETARLEDLAAREHQGMTDTLSLVTTTLEEAKKKINERIDEDVKKLIEKVRTSVQSILTQLKSISKELQRCTAELQDWISKVEKFIGEDIEKHVQKIVREMNKDASDEQPMQIKIAVQNATTAVVQLNGAGEEGIQRVTRDVKAALEQVKEMNEALKEDLWQVKDAVNTQVKEIKEAIGKLYKVVESGEPEGAKETDKTMVKVIGEIRDKMKDITGNDEKPRTPLTALQGIVSGLKWKYANEYKPEHFSKMVEAWLDAILGKDSTVKGTRAVNSWLSHYVINNTKLDDTYTRKDNGVHKALNERIRHAITSQLTSDNIIKAATDRYTSRHVTTLTHTLQNVKDVCETFAIKLDEKITEAEIEKFVKRIADRVETELRAADTSAYTYNFLKRAVRTTVISLASKASQAAKELESILLTSRVGDVTQGSSANIASEIDRVDRIAMTLESKLKQSLGQNGGRDRTNYAQAVDKAIDRVTSKLTEEIGEDGMTGTGIASNTISDIAVGKFTNYNEKVKRDTLALLESSPDKVAGQLPEAIINIKTQVSDALTPMVQLKSEAEQQLTQVTTILNSLCDSVKKSGETLNSNLQFLKGTYFENYDEAKRNARNSIKKIKHQISELRNADLGKVIHDVEKFLNGLNLTCDSTIQLLGSSVKEQICSAEKTLTTHARKQYVEAVKHLLTTFADKVTEDLKPLPREIQLDLEKGHKGFMTKFEKKFVAYINKIKPIAATSFIQKGSLKISPVSQAAKELNKALSFFFQSLNRQTDITADVDLAEPAKKAVITVLGSIQTSNHFDHTFVDNLVSLKNTMHEFNPRTYGDSNNPWLFESLKKGLSLLVEEFGKTYISTYSQETIEWEQATADEKLKYAKVLFTMTPFIYHELTELKEGLERKDDKWNLYGIYNTSDADQSLHAHYFRENGYDADLPDDAAHGALNHRETLKGSTILRYLTADKYQLFKQTATALSSSGDNCGLTVELEEENGLIRKLYDCLHTYSKVCHLIRVDKPRAPCSVYEILVWCCGLQFNPVYERLKAQIKSEFMKEDKERPGTKTLQPFEAHPSPFQHTHIDEALYKVSSDSHAVLTAILGHGHKDGIYACDFSSNSLKLEYPANMIQLLCTLFDLLKRLYHQLYFLLQQCKHNAQLSGWRDCHYGRGIGGSGWQCNTKQCPKQDCDQRHDQSGNQMGGQYPNCGVKSPLQSFLEDGLKGHLPHSVAARGSSLSCGTCGSTPGMPCRTPMGFADISAIASHTMIGQDICDVLYDFCGRPNSPLTRLCGYLNCLLPSAPKTLADMFSFYYHLTDRWGMHGNDHKSNAFDAIVKAANFGRHYNDLNVYHLFTPSHSALKKGHSDGSLGSLVCLSKEAVVCGPLLRPISNAIYETFSAKHADKYLSWIVYLTATFYDLLKKLYDECNSKCGARGSNCHGKSCVKGCPTTTIEQDPPRYHHRDCKSIVSCNATMPTLAKYGFVLGDPERLNGSERSQTKRTCRDFCDVFKEAFDKDSHLVQFFKAIDNFMFAIRAPFIWLNVALWSLSLFYLICVMVGRLDVLHIRSHLRIPSSHKITAQSLLAAAQVGRLAKISYLQP